jgi:hypothetical protein
MRVAKKELGKAAKSRGGDGFSASPTVIGNPSQKGKTHVFMIGP